MINVKVDFFAVGDGVTDDTAALQAALDSVRSGGYIYFPAGIYLTTACLIFYSHQHLSFEKGAVLLRGDEDQQYILANFTSPQDGGYTACTDAVIDGATFDGNKEIEYRITMMNTCHASGIIIRNCTFRNGCLWHFCELNSSENVLVEDCVFESSYSSNFDKGEELQLDFAKIGNYGPVINLKGDEIEFCPDDTVCRNIEIRRCKFNGYGFAPAIGNHGNAPHHHVNIHGNEFIGEFGHRGAIDFVDLMTDIDIHENIFTD